MVETLKRRGVWLGAVVAALLVVIAFFSTQAFSSGLTATSEPLQNAGTDGVINYDQDWSGASSVITRHESSDLTVDGSDLVTSVSVQGNKGSGAVDVKVDLLDVSQTILDTATVAVSSAAGGYDQAVSLTLGTVKLVGVAKVLATYTASGTPTNLTLNLTDGWDNKNSDVLTTLGTFKLIQNSDNSWLQIDSTYWDSFQFDGTVPAGATINSIKVYVEHWEDNGFKSAELTWEIGTGTLSSPTVLGSTQPGNLNSSSNEAVVEWDVSSWIDTLAEANDIKLKVLNGNTKGKKINLDHIYVVVNYTP